MNSTYVIVAIIVAIALIFDFTNGFHDAANSIATVVSTRVLSPVRAVILAAFFNFIAFFLTTHAVANTVYKGLVDPKQVNEWVVLAGLIGAVAWNLITWYMGLPTSSSHALIGGYAGAAISNAGFRALVFDTKWPRGWFGAMSFIVISPTVGLIAGLFLMTAVFWIFRRVAPSRVDKYFRFMQLISSSAFSFSHGTNDAQKTMGIIMAALVTGKFVDAGADIPYWVGLAAFMSIGLGTMSGGWRIVKTMGSKITKLKPVGGFCAETGGAGAVLLASHFGIPVSTTHTITGAIVGVGSTRRLSAVRWGVAGRIVWAWVVTIPAAGLIASVAYYVSKLVH
ncbi:MAG TPA: inorganic phosphate transporter [Blastocatellia bacterium]|nr:inorganic phosphate transporter [Blastocatellia bacterium]